jgi:ribonuclease D
MLITTSSALAEFCHALRGVPYIAVDTEFMREKSYYAYLCLVQVAHGKHVAAIDPLVEGLDMSPLYELLCDPTIVKVFHSAVQDLEILLGKIGQVPAPLFDTQIAAAVCGLGDQPGYAKVVADLLDIQIDKSSQMTDWSLRPLSERQLDYALSDVTHLCDVYEMLLERLASSDRTSWVADDMGALLDPARYRVEPTEAWRRIKLRRSKPKTLAVLRELAAWRESVAKARNIPRNWVARDEVLLGVAQSLPRTVNELMKVRSLKPQLARSRDGEALLRAVKEGLDSPRDSWPEVGPTKARLSGHESMVALLQALLQQRCRAFGVSIPVVAKRAELDRIATEDNPDVPSLRGWRREVFGADALELRAGRLALTGQQGDVVDVRIPGQK